jgi:ankyrin repeat protein
MRALLISFLLLLTSQATAECGNLCNDEWWKVATITDVKTELNAGTDIMARDAEGATPLHFASIYGTNELIQTLLSLGADISARNECDSAPLHFAASRGTVETIKALLDGGADIMALEADGWTPLHRAATCFDCSPENIHLLLDSGASVFVTDEEGMTPWDYAQENKTLMGTTGYFVLRNASIK